MVSSLYKVANGCILVYDITQPSTFETLLKIRSEFMTILGKTDTQKFPTILLGNKLDLEKDRKVSLDKVMEWCKTHGDIPYLEVSALNDTNIQKAFEDIAKVAMSPVVHEAVVDPNWNYY